MCSKVALGSAAEPPWPSKVLLETTSKPPVHSKVLPGPAPEPPNHAKHGPSLHHSEKSCSLQLPGRFALKSAARNLCFCFCVLFRFRFCSFVCLWCSCLFRCLLVRSFLRLLVFFGNVSRGNFSKVLFESAARNRHSKLLFEVTGLCGAGLSHSSLCSLFLRAWICTGSH